MKIDLYSSLNSTLISQISNLNEFCADSSNNDYDYEPYFEVEDTANDEAIIYNGGSDCGCACYALSFDESSSKNILTGFVSALLYEAEAEITGIIHPSYRNQHIFSTLLHQLVSVLKDWGYTKIYASIPSLPENENLSKCSLFNGVSHIEYLLIYKKDFNNAITNIDITNNTCIVTNISSFDLTPSTNTRFIKSFSNAECDISSKYCLRIKHTSNAGNPSWRTVSSCYLSKEASFTNIWNVETKKPYRNKGYGFELIRYVVNDYFNSSDTPLVLNVSDKNKPAFALYQKCGFKIQEQITYYSLI